MRPRFGRLTSPPRNCRPKPRKTRFTNARFRRDAVTSSRAQVTKNADIKATIDAMNPNCPRYQAHATLHYNMGSNEDEARKKFTELREQLQSQGQGPLDLKCAGPPEYWGDHAPYDMRAIGLTHHRTQELDALHAQAAAVCGLDYEEEIPDDASDSDSDLSSDFSESSDGELSDDSSETDS